jgi:hypothetical protein
VTPDQILHRRQIDGFGALLRERHAIASPRTGNCARIFDEARRRARAWGKAHLRWQVRAIGFVGINGRGEPKE